MGQPHRNKYHVLLFVVGGGGGRKNTIKVVGGRGQEQGEIQGGVVYGNCPRKPFLRTVNLH